MQNAIKCSHPNQFVFIGFYFSFTDIQQQEIVFNKNTGIGVSRFIKTPTHHKVLLSQNSKEQSSQGILLLRDLPIQNKSPNSVKKSQLLE